MASQIQNVDLTQLTRVERDSVEAFSRNLLAGRGKLVKSVSVHGLRGRGSRATGVLELMVLLKKPSAETEALVEELALDQFIETGITLRVTCFEQKQYKLFRSMNLPRVTELASDAIALFAA